MTIERLKHLALIDPAAAAALLPLATRAGDVEAFTILARAAHAHEDWPLLRKVGRWFIDADPSGTRMIEWNTESGFGALTIKSRALISDPRINSHLHMGFLASRASRDHGSPLGEKKRWLRMGRRVGEDNYTRLECLWAPAIARALACDMAASVRWLIPSINVTAHLQSAIDTCLSLGRIENIAENALYSEMDAARLVLEGFVAAEIVQHGTFNPAISALWAIHGCTDSSPWIALARVFREMQSLYGLKAEHAPPSPANHLSQLYKQNLEPLRQEHAQWLIQYYLGEKTPS